MFASLLRAQSVPLSPAGTWRIAVCRMDMECAVGDVSTRVIQRGLLVLSASPFEIAAFQEPGPLQMMPPSSHDPVPNPNGCYALDPRPDSEGGIVGFSRWQPMSGLSLAFTLEETYHSSWSVRVTLASDGNSFRGVRRYQARGANSVDTPDEVVVGQRTGRADPTPCVEASRNWLRALKDWSEWGSNFRGTRVFPPSIDSTAGYILYFWDALADSIPPPIRCVDVLGIPRSGDPCVASETSGYFGPFMTFGRRLAPRGTFVLAAAPNALSVQAQVDSAVVRVKTLLAAGVRPDRLILLGSGRATEIVLRLAPLVSDGIALGFVGECNGARVDSIRSRRPVFDAHPATTAPAAHCGSRFDAAPGSVEHSLPPWFDARFRDGSDDWLELARSWITEWIARSR